MSVTSEIERIQGAKADIKSAIEEKGVDVGDGLLDTYAAKVAQIAGSVENVHILTDKDLTNSTFLLKGKTKGLYLFPHSVGLLYDSNNTPSQTDPEACYSGILWLFKDVDPEDMSGGPVGAMISMEKTDSDGSTLLPTSCALVVAVPGMPTTMSGVVVSSSYTSINAVTPSVIAPYYSYKNTYNTGDLVMQSRKLYKCNANNVTGTWNASYWTQVTVADLLQG